MRAYAKFTISGWQNKAKMNMRYYLNMEKSGNMAS